MENKESKATKDLLDRIAELEAWRASVEKTWEKIEAQNVVN